MRIETGGLENEQVLALLREHLQGMHDNSPPGSVFALDLSGLSTADVSFYTAWDGETLLGMGALKEIDPISGEIKSMRTAADQLRRGVAAGLLEYMLDEARARGYRRLSLETGSGAAFEPALKLYRRYGFVSGGSFGDYVKSGFSQFMHLDLN